MWPSPLASIFGSRRLRHADGAEDVRVEHLLPSVEVGLLDRVETERAAGVVDEHAALVDRGAELVD